MLTKDMEFLIELQNEMLTQDKDCQASPRFWVIKDYMISATVSGNEDEMYISSDYSDYFGNIEGMVEAIKENHEVFDEYHTDEERERFSNISKDADSVLEFVQEHYDSEAQLVPVEEISYIVPNTMFITKQDAIDHLKDNSHNYTDQAHTYAMTALRSPKVEQLYRIILDSDFTSIKENL